MRLSSAVLGNRSYMIDHWTAKNSSLMLAGEQVSPLVQLNPNIQHTIICHFKMQSRLLVSLTVASVLLLAACQPVPHAGKPKVTKPSLETAASGTADAVTTDEIVTPDSNDGDLMTADAANTQDVISEQPAPSQNTAQQTRTPDNASQNQITDTQITAVPADELATLVEPTQGPDDLAEETTRLEDEAPSPAAPQPPAIVIPIKPPAGPRQLYPFMLSGADIERLQDTLGLPDHTRSEGKTRTWQYREISCVADFFLYPAGNTYTVTHITWRNPIYGRDVNTLTCRLEMGHRAERNS